MQDIKPERTLFPYGAATQAEVAGIIRSLCIDEDVRNLETIISEWREASNHFLKVVRTESGVPETIDTKEINASYKIKLDAITSNPLFKQTFSLHQIEINLVEIEKMVAPQRLVNLDFVQKLKARLPKESQIEDLIDFCLEPKQQPYLPKEIQLAPNAFAYSSPSSDFRFLGGYPKPLTKEDIEASTGGGLPAAALVLLVGYGSPTCNVYSVGKRIILNNGFHRMYALSEVGIKYAPVVVQKISNPDLEFPPEVAGLPKDYLIENTRPVLMRDFFDQKLVRVIHRKPTMKNVQIGWNVQQSLVPI